MCVPNFFLVKLSLSSFLGNKLKIGRHRLPNFKSLSSCKGGRPFLNNTIRKYIFFKYKNKNKYF